MKIAILGAGQVGGTLGKGWAKAGHAVKFGARDPAKPELQALVKQAGANASSGSVPEAAAFGEVIVLTTPWNSAQEALRAAGNLAGKILLDCTNPLRPDLSGLSLGHDTSAGEQVARWAPDTRVVKIFNSTGFSNMADPKYPEGAATMLYCGNDAEAKAVAGKLAADLGFDPVDAGPITMARLLEPLAMLWILLAVKQGLGRNIAFRIMRR
jgi:8-hydroxy-5-deazaflavin:NADPH oxidoreductase